MYEKDSHLDCIIKMFIVHPITGQLGTQYDGLRITIKKVHLKSFQNPFQLCPGSAQLAIRT